MLDSLYEKALVKRENINKQIYTDFDNIDVDPSKCWNEFPIREETFNVTICAGDGSINKKNFLSFIFYAIDAECLVYNTELNSIESSEIDIILHHRHVDDRLRSYMGIFEIKNALKAFREYDVDKFLFDGSILGNLIRPSPLENKLNNDVKEKIRYHYSSELEQKLKKELEYSEVAITSSKFTKTIEDEFKKNKIDAMIYLEHLENLMVIKELLKNNKSVVAISKTSTSNEYFDSEIPDMAIFDRYSRKEGYSDPKYIKVSNPNVKREDFPVKNEFFRGLTFTIFYARLENHKNILKFELPYEANKEQIKHILSLIKGNSAEGYPLLLKKAHNDVVIRKVDLDRLSKIIGFMEKSGREML
ncbi:MAG: DNA double-strand break repair nuclease NurA [Methanobacterium sp.]